MREYKIIWRLGLALRWTHWRGAVVVLTVVGVAIMTTTPLALPETLPTERRRTGGLGGTPP